MSAALPPTWMTLMPKAEQIVREKYLYKRFIDGTPLANDVPCWMTDFALAQIDGARADLEAENIQLRMSLEWIVGYIQASPAELVWAKEWLQIARSALKEQP